MFLGGSVESVLDVCWVGSARFGRRLVGDILGHMGLQYTGELLNGICLCLQEWLTLDIYWMTFLCYVW